MFSNGELFDYKVHGPWHDEFVDDVINETEYLCPEPFLNSWMDKIWVNNWRGCGRTEGVYICFQAKQLTTAKALSVQEGNKFYFAITGFVFGAFVCLIIAFVNNRYNKLKESLSLQ